MDHWPNDTKFSYKFYIGLFLAPKESGPLEEKTGQHWFTVQHSTSSAVSPTVIRTWREVKVRAYFSLVVLDICQCLFGLTFSKWFEAYEFSTFVFVSYLHLQWLQIVYFSICSCWSKGTCSALLCSVLCSAVLSCPVLLLLSFSLSLSMSIQALAHNTSTRLHNSKTDSSFEQCVDRCSN